MPRGFLAAGEGAVWFGRVDWRLGTALEVRPAHSRALTKCQISGLLGVATARRAVWVPARNSGRRDRSPTTGETDLRRRRWPTAEQVRPASSGDRRWGGQRLGRRRPRETASTVWQIDADYRQGGSRDQARFRRRPSIAAGTGAAWVTNLGRRLDCADRRVDRRSGAADQGRPAVPRAWRRPTASSGLRVPGTSP